ncbi:hypothetical protein [Niallia sp. Marseille-Q9988]|uniref:ATP synthase F0 subunit 8 n=1 Tax=Niallia hominis TaxID=3133173 RepID=A0ABV1EVG2_9BACI
MAFCWLVVALVVACTIIMDGFLVLIQQKMEEINSFYNSWIVSISIQKLKAE